MSSVNRLILVGRAGADAELRFTPDGAAVASFRLATTQMRRDRRGRTEVVDWHSVAVEGDLGYAANDSAKRAATLVRKGAQVYVEGRLSYRNAGTSAVPRKVAIVLADRVEVIDAPARQGQVAMPVSATGAVPGVQADGTPAGARRRAGAGAAGAAKDEQP